MVRLAVLYLVLISELRAANCNWDDGEKDSTYSNLGFYVLHMACDNKGTGCRSKFASHVSGQDHAHVLEYSSEPRTVRLSLGRKGWHWQITYSQDDSPEPFRLCYDEKAQRWTGFGKVNQTYFCLDNNFSEISVPGECGQPLLVVSLSGSVPTDDRIHGQQILYCLPKLASE